MTIPILLACSSAPATSDAPALTDVPPTTLDVLDATQFAGKWFVSISNVPFWRAPKANAAMTFRHEEAARWRNAVWYTEPGRDGARVIRGAAEQDSELAGHFAWRGDGLLHMAVSHRYIVAFNPDDRWAVAYLSSSNFAAGQGLEILTRAPCPTPDVETAALRSVLFEPFLAARADNLFRIPHDACPTRPVP